MLLSNILLISQLEYLKNLDKVSRFNPIFGIRYFTNKYLGQIFQMKNEIKNMGQIIFKPAHIAHMVNQIWMYLFLALFFFFFKS